MAQTDPRPGWYPNPARPNIQRYRDDDFLQPRAAAVSGARGAGEELSLPHGRSVGIQSLETRKGSRVVARRGASAILTLVVLLGVPACSADGDGGSQRVDSAVEIADSLKGTDAACDSVEPVEASTEELDELGMIELALCDNELGDAFIYVYVSERARLLDTLRIAGFGCSAAPDSSSEYVHGVNWVVATSNDSQLLEAIEEATGGSLNVLDCTEPSPEIDLPDSLEDATVEQLRALLGEGE